MIWRRITYSKLICTHFFLDDEGNAYIMDPYGCTDKQTRYLTQNIQKPNPTNRFDKFIINDPIRHT